MTSGFNSPPHVMSNDEIVPKNELRTLRNEALQTRWDDRESPIPTDEPLIPLPSPPSSSNTGTHLHQVLAAFVQLSPASQVKASAAVNSLGLTNSTPCPDTSSVSKVLFDTSKELPASEAFDSTYNLSIHHLVIELVEARQYLPLMLFTNKNNKHLHSEAYMLKCIKAPTSVGTNTHLLDLSQFESEDTLDPLSWQEAWGHYLTWIVDITPHDAHAWWSRHFLSLSKDEGLQDCFKAILCFDIETCCNYILKPCQQDKEQWKHHLTKIKYEVLQEEVQLCLADRSQTSRPRFETQDKDSHGGVKRPHAAQRPKSNPMCIICQQSGHHFPDCTETTTSKGVVLFAKYSGGQLCKRSGRNPICVSFNLSNPRHQCKSDDDAQHICSFCEDSSHATLSCLCI
ncbi:hypothetical protein PAXRUDRAFT_151840 [Paxillus rubicundulus Ve08.2h10]|uniref:Uncharacterized protein n=1 Tax=Paxillus rubicundulus Ve08.2h10 TaxID=930991 RepID=A0A0D0DHW5_9AGAM|nr:hypothetical protein PAXRUDRAFT_151840 [Paxillus rubicundulus Ve08.2h10]